MTDMQSYPLSYGSHDMKFTWQDIVDGLFPTKEQIRKREEQRIALHRIMGEVIAKHKGETPDELLAKSEFIRERLSTTHPHDHT
jgi:hypothetical protein